MSLAAFDWTTRVRPIVEVGIGLTRVPTTNAAKWDVARWDSSSTVWAGTQPSWWDITCDVRSFRCEYGRAATIDRFVPGVASVVLDNASGWADPSTSTDPFVLSMRPGREIRLGVVHAVYGTRWLFRGFVDAMEPRYLPTDTDTVELSCVDALGEVNRAKVTPLASPSYADDTVNVRIGRLLDLAKWTSDRRRLDATGETLVADELGGQIADLLGQAADSGGGSVFADTTGDIVYRMRDWQVYVPGTPPDGTIGNVDPADVCPTGWERPFRRADMSTRVIIGRDLATAQTIDDTAGMALYGIEPFERTDLLTAQDPTLTRLGNRILQVRSAASTPRIRSVTFDGRTGDDVVDLMSSVDVFKPSRYRCRLQYPRGTVFDAEHLATGVVHEVTPRWWTLGLNLDLAAPYAAPGGRWDGAYWDRSTWAA